MGGSVKKKEPQRKRETVSLNDEIGEYLAGLEIEGVTGVKSAYAKQGGASGLSLSKTAKATMNLLVIWQKIASERVLKHTDNVVYSTRSKDTEILVYVDSPVYAAELTMDKEIYRLRMQQETGKDISDIKFLISRRTSLRKKSGGS
jgi:hypothetical protein